MRQNNIDIIADSYRCYTNRFVVDGVILTKIKMLAYIKIGWRVYQKVRLSATKLRNFRHSMSIELAQFECDEGGVLRFGAETEFLFLVSVARSYLFSLQIFPQARRRCRSSRLRAWDV